MNVVRCCAAVIYTLLLLGCQSAYYAAMEKVGVEKRDILVNRVEDAAEAQQQAQQQFQSALEQLSALIEFDGGELQRLYEQVSDDYDESYSAASLVSDRIDSIEDVADALFDEWQQELEQYSNANFRRQSERQLATTKRHYQRLIKSMRITESKMQPVLATLKDNVLYLKHNLNARAIGALKGEFGKIKVDINALITDMNNTIDESNRFIQQLKNQS